MGGGEKFSKVISSLNRKTGQVTSPLYKIEPSGTIDVSNALKIGSLILKNREQKHFTQRIILFVASPIRDALTVDDYKMMGTQLKSAGIYLDIVSIGEINENYDKLHALFDAAKRGNNENKFVTLASGAGILTDVLFSTFILNAPSGSGTAGGAGAGAGVADMDDDLARALRESMADANNADLDEDIQKAMLASLTDFNAQNAPSNVTNGVPQKETQPVHAATENPPPPQQQQQQESAPVADDDDDDMMDIDDEELKLAIQMSLMEEASSNVPVGGEKEKEEEVKKEEVGDSEKKKEEKPLSLDDIDPTKLIDDADFVNSVLSGLDGVDPDEAKKHLGDGADKKDEDKK